MMKEMEKEKNELKKKNKINDKKNRTRKGWKNIEINEDIKKKK
jgi:hypothetical protein